MSCSMPAFWQFGFPSGCLGWRIPPHTWQMRMIIVFLNLVQFIIKSLPALLQHVLNLFFRELSAGHLHLSRHLWTWKNINGNNLIRVDTCYIWILPASSSCPWTRAATRCTPATRPGTSSSAIWLGSPSNGSPLPPPEKRGLWWKTTKQSDPFARGLGYVVISSVSR